LLSSVNDELCNGPDLEGESILLLFILQKSLEGLPGLAATFEAHFGVDGLLEMT